MKKVVRVEAVLNEEGKWDIAVTSELRSNHGGGSQVYRKTGGNEIYGAINVLRVMLCNLELENMIEQGRAETEAAIARGDMLICYPLRPIQENSES